MKPLTAVDPSEVFVDLKIPEGVKGRWVVSHEPVRKGSKMQVTTLRDAITGGDPTFSIVAPRKMVIHSLREMRGKPPCLEKASVWMSDYPSEVYSHVKHLRDFHGRVLVGGLGLGVAVTYLESLPQVKEIIVVEKSRDVVKLVWPHLKTKKSKVVHMDLFCYLKNYLTRRDFQFFDWAFFDIWISSGEHTFNNTVFPLRRLASTFIAPDRIRCWKEESMLGQIRMDAEIQVSMWQASQRMEGKIPGGFLEEAMKEHVFNYSKEQFNKTREMLGTKWAFYHWCRESGASVEEMYTRLKNFMVALVDPTDWDECWAKWYAEER